MFFLGKYDTSVTVSGDRRAIDDVYFYFPTDIEAPLFSLCPDNQFLPLDKDGHPQFANFTVPKVTDNSGVITSINTYPPNLVSPHKFEMVRNSNI